MCRFLWANKTGDFDPLSNSFDGAIGLLVGANAKADTYLRSIDYGVVDPKFVDYLTYPNSAVAMVPLQLIERLANQQMEKSLSSFFHFLVPSTAFLALLATSCLLKWLLPALICLAKKSRPSRKKLQLKILKILWLFYFLFSFFIQQFFCGNLNTENVVVRTDDLLYSKEQVLRTNKELCVFKTRYMDSLPD